MARDKANDPIGQKAEFTVDYVRHYARKGKYAHTHVEPAARLYVGHTVFPDKPEYNIAVLSINWADDSYLVRRYDPLQVGFDQLVLMAKQLTWRQVDADHLLSIGWVPD